MADRRDGAAGKLQSIIAVGRFRLVGEAGLLQRPKEPIAATISSEHSPGSICAMGCGRQSDDEQACPRVAEIGHWPSPIVPVLKGAAFFDGDATTVGAQPWAQFTVNNLSV